MKVTEIFEGISQLLYHSTTFKNALSIIQSDKFMLTPDIANKAEQKFRQRGKIYYLSASRIPTGKFQRSMPITFDLDGKVLAHNHSGTQVNYFDNPKDSENEDRVFSNSPYIDNAMKYVTSIHIDISDIERNHTESIFRKILLELFKIKTPLFVYQNKKDYDLKLRSRALYKKDDIVSYMNMDNLPSPSPKNATQKDYKGEQEIKILLELYHTESKDKLSKKAFRELSILNHTNDYQYIEGLIDTFKKGGYKGNSRTLIEKLIKIIQKERLGNIESFIDFLVTKFTDS